MKPTKVQASAALSLRTIVGWAVYDPRRKIIVTMHALKKHAQPSKYHSISQSASQTDRRRYPGCVLVKMKGHYLQTAAMQAALIKECATIYFSRTKRRMRRGNK